MRIRDPPRGRPRKEGSRPRNPLSDAAKQKIKDGSTGNFPSRVWQHKKHYFETELRRAYTIKEFAEGKVDVWIHKKGKLLYKKWRDGPEFRLALRSIYTNIEKYWRDEKKKRQLSRPEVVKMVISCALIARFH